MLSSAIPTRVPVPFASGAGAGFINPIPIPSQIVGGSDPGIASMTDGFTPRTFIPEGSGGLPPRGQDFNGILNLHSTAIQWAQLGCTYVYNATFQTAIGGYPKGAVLARSDLTGGWISTTENNVTNPETLGAGWLPYDGSTTPLSVAMTGSSITLTALQAASRVITITGTLSANVNVVLPAWVGVQWLIINNANAGVYSVTAKTPSGSGAAIVGATPVVCTSAGIVSTAQPGRLLRTTLITASGTFSPHPLANVSRVRGTGGGGAGGGSAATGSTTVSVGTGGSCGAYCEVMIGKMPAQSVTIGAGGVGVSGGNGGAGGTSAFGGFVTLPGGPGGIASAAGVPPFINGSGSASADPTLAFVNVLLAFPGTQCTVPAFALSTGSIINSLGASNPMGQATGSRGFGSGGVGRAQGVSQVATAGGSGGNGAFIVEEFS